MPNFRLETNISKDKVPKGAGKELSSLIAKTLGKPENYCCVTIIPDQNMIFAGTDEPCAQAVLTSIGQLGTEENMKHSKVIFEKVKELFGIPATRMYIHFQDVPSSEYGYNGTTFYKIFGGY